MAPDIVAGIEFFFYKIACLFVGLAFCYMGYRLFLTGIERGGDDAKDKGGTPAKSEKYQWLVKISKDPGTWFSIFGALIVIFAVCSDYRNTHRITTTSQTPAEELGKVQLPEKLPRN